MKEIDINDFFVSLFLNPIKTTLKFSPHFKRFMCISNLTNIECYFVESLREHLYLTSESTMVKFNGLTLIPRVIDSQVLLYVEFEIL